MDHKGLPLLFSQACSISNLPLVSISAIWSCHLHSQDSLVGGKFPLRSCAQREQSGSDIAKESWAPAWDSMLLGCMEDGLEWVVSWLYSLTPSDASIWKTSWRGQAEYSASPGEAFFRAYSGNIDRRPSCQHKSFHRE